MLVFRSWVTASVEERLARVGAVVEVVGASLAMPSRQGALCSDERVPVEALTSDQDLSRLFGVVSYPTGPELSGEEGAVGMPCGVIGGAGVGCSLAVVL